MKKTTKLKLGDWLLDVAKYSLTVGIITTFFGFIEEKTTVLYLFSAVVFIVCLVVGIWFIDKNS